MDTFTAYAAGTLGIVLPLTALPLAGYLIYAVIDLYVWWRKELIKYEYSEKRKRPPYDEIRITEYFSDRTIDIDLIRDGEVIWSGEKDFDDKQSDPYKTTVVFRKNCGTRAQNTSKQKKGKVDGARNMS